jgi:hypothetical protein
MFSLCSKMDQYCDGNVFEMIAVSAFATAHKNVEK